MENLPLSLFNSRDLSVDNLTASALTLPSIINTAVDGNLLWVDTNNLVGKVDLGGGLSWSSGALSVSTSGLVSGTLPISVSGAGAVSLGYNSTNLTQTADQLNTIQNIDLTATPTFNKLSLLGPLQPTYYNIAIGGSGASSSVGGYSGTASSNIAIGDYYCLRNCSGDSNFALGRSCMGNPSVLEGEGNCAVGTGALAEIYGASSYNVGIGMGAAGVANAMNSCVAIGYYALGGSGNDDFSNHTCIGHQAGYSLATESTGSVMIGYQAGLNETLSDKLYISNSATSAPLVYGDFSTNLLTINNNLILSGLTGTAGLISQTAGKQLQSTTLGTNLSFTGAELKMSDTPSFTGINLPSSLAHLTISGVDGSNNARDGVLILSGTHTRGPGLSLKYINCTPILNGNVTAGASAYGGYFNSSLANVGGGYYTDAAQIYIAAGSVSSGDARGATNTYGLYAAAPGYGTNRAGIYTDSLFVGTAVDSTNTAGTIKGGSLTLSGLSAGGMVKSTAGLLSIASASSDYQPFITAGTTLQFYRGDKTWAVLNTAAVPESGNLYYTDARARSAISYSGNASFTYTAATGAMALTNTPTFTGLTVGALSGVLKASAGVISGAATTTDLTEGTNLYYTDTRARAAISGTLPISVSSGVVSIAHNTTNMKITSNQLNTIQNINTTATPNFSGIQLGTSYRSDAILWIEGNALSNSSNIYNVLINNAMTTTGTTTSINKLAVLGNANANPGTTGYIRGIWVGESGSSGTFGRRIGLRIENTGWDMGISCGGGATFGYGHDITKASGEVCISSKLAIGTSTNTNALDVVGAATITGLVAIGTSTTAADKPFRIAPTYTTTFQHPIACSIEGTYAMTNTYNFYGLRVSSVPTWSSGGGSRSWSAYLPTVTIGGASVLSHIGLAVEQPASGVTCCAIAAASISVGTGGYFEGTHVPAGRMIVQDRIGIGTFTPANALDCVGLGSFTSGITVNSGSTLSTYLTTTSVSTALSGFSGSPTMSMSSTRIGNVVFLMIPNVDLTFGGATTFASFPVPYTPSVEQHGFVKTRQAGAWNTPNGGFYITGGTCRIYRYVNEVGFTAGAALCGWAPQTLTYYL